MRSVVVWVSCLLAGIGGGWACGSSSDNGLLGASRSDAGSSKGTGAASGTGGATSAGAGGGDASAGGTSAGGTSGGGVACTSDKQCTPIGKLCDTRIAQCVECSQNSDCATGFGCRNGACEKIYSCANSLDCASVPGGRVICDPGAKECVECVSSNDCDPNHDCILRVCVPFTPCKTSLDCGTTQVCDGATQRCVACVGNADCDKGLVCRNHFCESTTCVPEQCAGRCGILSDGCGGPLGCGACITHCSDGVQNGGETGVDCGGPECAPCAVCLTQSACAGKCGSLPNGCGTILDCGPCATGGTTGAGGTSASGGGVGTGGLTGTGGSGTGGTTTGGAGAWDPCLQDSDCATGRVCTKVIQETLLQITGRYGFCVKTCPGTCDPAPAGAPASSCIVSYCGMPCPGGTCGVGLDCVQTTSYGLLCMRGALPP